MSTLAQSARGARRLQVPNEFAWLKQLNPKEQAQFFSGLLERLHVATNSNNWSSVTDWIEEWQATANIYADQQVAKQVREGRSQLVHRESIEWQDLRKELGL